MRKDIRGCRIEVLCEALDKLGYEGAQLHTGFPSEYWEYKKDSFHLKIRERRGSSAINIHKDPEFHYIGRSRGKGEDIELELKTIIQTYKRLLKLPLQPVKRGYR